MLKPSDIEQLKGDHSRYAVVVAVAKHARDIADKAIEEKRIILEKPVSMAIDDFKQGDYKIFMNAANDENEAAPQTEE